LAGYLDGLHSFDPATMAWTLLSAAANSSSAPYARALHGFMSAGGKLYVHGGSNFLSASECKQMSAWVQGD
jgi:hypothetical protein